MNETDFERKIYGRLKFDTNFGSKALRNFAGGCEIFFARVAEIFVGLRKFSAFSAFVFFLLFHV